VRHKIDPRRDILQGVKKRGRKKMKKGLNDGTGYQLEVVVKRKTSAVTDVESIKKKKKTPK